MPTGNTQIRSRLMWRIGHNEIVRLYNIAYERLPTLDKVRRESAEKFLDSVTGYMKYPAFVMSGAQLSFLCDLANVDTRQYTVLEVACHERFTF